MPANLRQRDQFVADHASQGATFVTVAATLAPQNAISSIIQFGDAKPVRRAFRLKNEILAAANLEHRTNETISRQLLSSPLTALLAASTCIGETDMEKWRRFSLSLLPHVETIANAATGSSLMVQRKADPDDSPSSAPYIPSMFGMWLGKVYSGFLASHLAL